MQKKLLLIILLALGLSTNVVLTNIVAVANPAANIRVRERNHKKPVRRSILEFKAPKERPTANREGGEPAGECLPSRKNLNALLSPRPKNLEINKTPVEITLNSHPTFFVHFEQSPIKQAEFLLRDENSEILLREDIDLYSTNGIISYSLPKSFKGLEVGKKYKWRFSLFCSRIDRSANPKIGAWIQRVEPSKLVAKQLAAAKDDFQRSVIYAENGFWHETIKSLTDLRAANPNDKIITESLRNVLKSAGLESLANKPVIQVTGVPSED
jgi:hypothetical protein